MVDIIACITKMMLIICFVFLLDSVATKVVERDPSLAIKVSFRFLAF